MAAPHRSLHRLCLVLVAGILVGCPGDDLPHPETLAECKSVAETERAAAEAAWSSRDAKAAEKAAKRAEAAAKRAAQLLKAERAATSEVSALDALKADETRRLPANDAAQAARDARHFADLATETEALQKKVSGIPAKAYTKISKTAVNLVFKGLAEAAEAAAKAKADGSLERLPESTQATAGFAADLALELAGGKPGNASSEDWIGVATTLVAYTVNTRQRTHLLLALALTLMARDGMALYELEGVDPAKLESPAERLAYHLLRGIVLRLNGFPTLAGVALEQAATEAGLTLGGDVPPDEIKELGPALMSGVHLLLALYYIDQKDLGKADAQIAHAMRVHPQNPLTTFLTGEKLAASGSWEEAAESLEKTAAGTKNEWLAKKIADRAREVRDAKGETPPLLSDSRFLVEVCLYYIKDAAKESEAAGRLQQTIDRARGFGKRTLDRIKELGGIGGGSDEAPDADAETSEQPASQPTKASDPESGKEPG